MHFILTLICIIFFVSLLTNAIDPDLKKRREEERVKEILERLKKDSPHLFK